MGRTVVVTGAGRGIGEGIAKALADDGWHVVVCDVDEASAKATAEEVDGSYEVFDVRDLDEVAAAASRITDGRDDVRALVNNVGWDDIMPFDQTDAKFWRKILEVNLLGSIALTHALLPAIRSTGGRIVNISSDAARTGSTGEVVYSAAKAGLLGFTRSLARETAADKVTVNAVCPGPTDTPLNRKVFEDKPRLMESLRRSIPLARAHDRIGSAGDVANAVVFLCSDKSEWITGQTLSVNGGLVIG